MVQERVSPFLIQISLWKWKTDDKIIYRRCQVCIIPFGQGFLAGSNTTERIPVFLFTSCTSDSSFSRNKIVKLFSLKDMVAQAAFCRLNTVYQQPKKLETRKLLVRKRSRNIACLLHYNLNGYNKACHSPTILFIPSKPEEAIRICFFRKNVPSPLFHLDTA